MRIRHLRNASLFLTLGKHRQQMRLDLFACMAAYSDHGPGDIGTSIAYSQGGYEVGPPSNTAPEVEGVLMSTMRKLLDSQRWTPVTPRRRSVITGTESRNHST